jgi:3'-phosphoadenosine 5'-phosphosulfate sulfotransferase (PAPS reductase)/FAD synthetase
VLNLMEKRKFKRIVPFSAGKDSEATLIWACEKFGPENITAVFCDVKWDHQLTYDHLMYVVEKLGCELIILCSKKYNGIVDLAVKKRFPSATRRLCTVFLKVEPMIDYILDDCNCNVMIYQGIRADESEARSLMDAQCTYFKYYFEPFETNSKIIERYTSLKKLNKVQTKKLQKAKDRLALGKEDKKYHTYSKKDVFAFRENYCDDIERPFFNATANEVIYFSLNRGFLIHPFYFMGISRIGCFPCIMATLSEMEIIVDKFSEVIDKIRDGEKLANSSFFGINYIPNRYHTGLDIKSGTSFPYIDDVVRYLKDRSATGDLFADDKEVNGCKSVYAVCE